MRIAIPIDDDRGMESSISGHFGRASHYVFIDVKDNKITSSMVKKIPFDQHQPGDLPGFVRENDGNMVVAYGMGGRAVQFFDQFGIKVLTGAQGRVKDVVDQLLKDELVVDRDWEAKEEFHSHEHGGH